MCSRFQLKMPATHFSGLSSRTGLDPLAARTPPRMCAQTRAGLAFSVGLQGWGGDGTDSHWKME